MTTDLEKQFFDTFGIEPYDKYYNCKDNLEGECTIENTCCCCDKSEDVYCYPEITDRILLELICIAHQHIELGDYIDKQGLIGAVLRALIYCYECGINNKFIYTSKEAQTLKQQVQALFKE